MTTNPDINSIRYDYSSVEININGQKFTAVKAISYKHGLKPGAVRGTSAMKNGRTRGQYEPEASVTMYKADYDELINALGDGYMEIAFGIVVSFADVGQPTSTTQIIGARIADEDTSMEEGSDAIVVKVDLDVMGVIPNGKRPVRNMNL
jgi:hypothetical protein